MIRLGLCLCFCLIAANAQAADVDPSLCRDIDDSTRPFVPTRLHPWYKFEHAVQACPTYTKHGEFLWWIITVNLDFEPWEALSDPAYHPPDPNGFTRRRAPRPSIIDSGGNEIGRLSDAFPTGGFPSRTELFFSQWKDDFPQHITIKVFNARAMGNYVPPPLHWNPKTRHYDQIGKGDHDDAP